MSLIPSIFGGKKTNVSDPLSLETWDPFKDCPFLRNLASFPNAEGGELAAAPRIDWKETPEAHMFAADLPGLKKEEVKVEVEDGRVVVISGERATEKEEGNEKWRCVERSGKFLWRFRLPEDVKVEEVKAGMENGVVPKAEVKKPEVKAIDITNPWISKALSHQK